jgi:hypothetical protein
LVLRSAGVSPAVLFVLNGAQKRRRDTGATFACSECLRSYSG